MHKYSIALVSDYFYPNFGGIETHIEMLATHFVRNGHKVIVLTHQYGGHTGVMRLNDIKVYYLNIPVLAMNTTFPSLFSNFFVFAEIFKKEKIEIVHGHQTMSNLAIEALFHAKTFNIKTVLTEHSLFEVGGFENIVVNNIVKVISNDVDKFICVSYTTKENLMNRLEVESARVHVIPNGILHGIFYPKPAIKSGDERHSPLDGETIKIVVVSRLVKRKGVDILIRIIPKVCRLSRKYKFVIVGDGPKRDELEQMVDYFELHDNVRILGAVNHQNVPAILRECDIFLNTSLTEAFCMTILEACSCGLQVVSTNVGGIHEVLPGNLITLTSLGDADMIKSILKATNKRFEYKEIEQINREMYSWSIVADRTIQVYDNISNGCRQKVRDGWISSGAWRFVFGLLYFFENILYSIYKNYYE